MALVNSLRGRETARPEETLGSYEALVAWARANAGLAPGVADALLTQARRHPHAADRALARVRELREALHLVFLAAAAGTTPPSDALERFAASLARAYRRARLVPIDGALTWAPAPADGLSWIGDDLARAAGRLAGSPRLARVRRCAADDCRWWFVDDTKNHSRRWCDMAICGNRAKLRRFRGQGG